jgi:hypothetical protein
MYIVGIFAVTLAAIIVVGLLTLGVLSSSDIGRYLRIRNM